MEVDPSLRWDGLFLVPKITIGTENKKAAGQQLLLTPP